MGLKDLLSKANRSERRRETRQADLEADGVPPDEAAAVAESEKDEERRRGGAQAAVTNNLLN